MVDWDLTGGFLQTSTGLYGLLVKDTYCGTRRLRRKKTGRVACVRQICR